MATFGIKQQSPSLLVLGKPLAARLVNLVIALVILGALGYVLYAWLGDSESGGQGPGIVLLFLIYLIWTNLSSGAVGKTVTIDSSARRVSATTDLLGIPLSRMDLSFDRIRRVLVNARVPVLSAQTGARQVWQVVVEPSDGTPLVVNTNGIHSQMLDLGNKISRQTGLPLVDELAQVLNTDQPQPALQPIQDFSGGGTPSYAPPVAAPIPLGRRARSIPSREQRPPANTLTMDSGESDSSEETTRPSQLIVERINQDATPDLYPSVMSAPSDNVQPAMPSMPSMGMSGATSLSGMPSMPPLGSGPAMGQSFSMPPLGGMGTGGEFAPSSYSPPPLTMPDQPPLGSLSAAPTLEPPGQVSMQEESASASPASWVRPRTEQELQQALADDPTDSVAFYQMARLWHARGDYDRAHAAYLQAIHLDPASAPAQNDLGVLYLQRGKYKEAEEAFRRASGLDPFFVIGHYNLGLLLARMRRGSEARQPLTRGQQSAANDTERQLFDSALQGVFVSPQLSPL